MTTALPNLTILDVGHGQCVVLQDARGTVIFDAGSGPTLLEFLHESGIAEIDAVIISHADADHLSGLVSLPIGSNSASSPGVSEFGCYQGF